MLHLLPDLSLTGRFNPLSLEDGEIVPTHVRMTGGMEGKEKDGRHTEKRGRLYEGTSL